MRDRTRRNRIRKWKSPQICNRIELKREVKQLRQQQRMWNYSFFYQFCVSKSVAFSFTFSWLVSCTQTRNSERNWGWTTKKQKRNVDIVDPRSSVDDATGFSAFATRTIAHCFVVIFIRLEPNGTIWYASSMHRHTHKGSQSTQIENKQCLQLRRVNSKTKRLTSCNWLRSFFFSLFSTYSNEAMPTEIGRCRWLRKRKKEMKNEREFCIIFFFFCCIHVYALCICEKRMKNTSFVIRNLFSISRRTTTKTNAMAISSGWTPVTKTH